MTNAVPQTHSSSNAEPTFIERVAAIGAWAIAAATFLTIGWIALSPRDPLGPVSLFTGSGGLFMLLQAAALAGVVAGIATLLTGRQLVDAGVFAAGLGMAAVSFRGSTAAYFFQTTAESVTAIERSVASRFAFESLGWFAVVVVTIAVSTFVTRFCFASSQDANGSANQGSDVSLGLAGSDFLSLRRTNESAHHAGTPFADGWKYMVVTAGVTLVAFTVLTEGLADRTVRHGQACFVVAGAVYLGCYVGFRMFPVRSSLWPILAVLLFVILGYAWAMLNPSSGVRPPMVSGSQFTRILPIQFISVGTASAVAAFWHMYLRY